MNDDGVKTRRRAASSAGQTFVTLFEAVKACWLRHEANKAETRAVSLASGF